MMLNSIRALRFMPKLDIASTTHAAKLPPRRLLPHPCYSFSLWQATHSSYLHIHSNASAARLSLKSISPTPGAAAYNHSQYFVRDCLTPGISRRAPNTDGTL